MSRATIILTASSQNGITEAPAGSNKNKFGAWYGMNGVPWCAIFVSWVYDQAGYPLGQIDSPKGYHYCPSAYNFWKRTNRLTTQPREGDIVLFDWNGDGWSDHTGIFVKWIKASETFQSWEGNTSVNHQSNGGQVMLRTRNVAVVKAFVNPGVFSDAVTAVPAVYKKGDRGAAITQIQKSLNELAYTITVDGHFGSKTETVVKQFQKNHHLPITGMVDEIMQGALQAELHKPSVPKAKTITGSFLKKGDAGAMVVSLQKALNKNGAKLKVDGMFGADTLTALKAYQKKNKLKVDGVAGPQTFKSLKL